MFQRIKVVLVWLWRIGHCRGFGIQSPTDYRFACDVINGKGGYEGIWEDETSLGRVERKLCRLYFRIARERKPRLAVLLRPCNAAATSYVRHGCPTVTVKNEMPKDKTVDMLIIGEEEDWAAAVENVGDRLAERCVAVFEGISNNKAKRQQWEAVKADKRFAITYDLYYVGIAIKDSKRYKQNYIVNF